MTTTPHTGSAEALALQLDDYARGDKYQRCTEEAAAMLRSQAQEIERQDLVYVGQSFRLIDMERERDTLRNALSALIDPAGYTIGYPSSSVQAKAAREALGHDAGMLHNGMRVDPKAWPVLTDPQEIRECFERDDNESVNA